MSGPQLDPPTEPTADKPTPEEPTAALSAGDTGPQPDTEPEADPQLEGETPAPAPAITGAPQRSRWRILRGPVAVAFLCGSLGFALAAQLAGGDADDTRLSSLRQSDLVRILDELDSRERRLRGEIGELEFLHQTLTSQSQGSESALADAQRRASQLGLLAGTVPADGPGVEILVIEDTGEFAADKLVDTVQELRGAGAEAIAVTGAGNQAVRVGASTYFTDVGKDIDIDGKQLAGPYRITAIGDPPTMDKALRILGGIVAVVQDGGCTISIEQRRTVQITAVRQPRAPRYAQPVS